MKENTTFVFLCLGYLTQYVCFFPILSIYLQILQLYFSLHLSEIPSCLPIHQLMAV